MLTMWPGITRAPVFAPLMFFWSSRQLREIAYATPLRW
jgi:hypothetical protein